MYLRISLLTQYSLFVDKCLFDGFGFLQLYITIALYVYNWKVWERIEYYHNVKWNYPYVGLDCSSDCEIKCDW